MTDAAILKNVSFRYANGDTGALDHIDLTIKQGECILLCGASGCGKTTITRLLNGLIPHYFEGELQGEIAVSGRNIRDTPIEELAGTVGSVFQNPRSQFFCVDTTAEIAFGCENMGLPENEIADRVRQTVSDMYIEKLMNRSIFNLSGGEKQKIACASVSAMLPELIVLDEPTSNLDLDAIEELREIIAIWKAQGKTIVIAEHRLGWLQGLCDRVLVLENGKIQRNVTGTEFFSMPAQQLHDIGLRATTAHTNYLESKTGLFPITNCDFAETLTLENFICGYGKQEALHIEYLELPKGAVIAVVGHNGAGKSTFTKCLCGLQKGFKGRVSINGKQYRPKDMMKLSYMVMQDVNHQLFAESVIDEVNTTTLKAVFRRIFGCSIYAYAKNRKMFYAAVLLRDTDMKIIDIAEEAGYCNASKFSSAFSSVIGVSPSVYRRSFRMEQCKLTHSRTGNISKTITY